jgi:AraC-like DNA-binding protein
MTGPRTLSPCGGAAAPGIHREGSMRPHSASLLSSRGQPLAPVATLLAPSERVRVDAAGEGLYRALHRETLDDVLRDLREREISAVLLSVACCDPHAAMRLGHVVREFPRVPAVALLTRLEPRTPQQVLALGQSGVRRLVDVREPTGWRQLREVLVAERADELQAMALEQLALDLAGAAADCVRFFEALFRAPPRVTTVRALARLLGVVPSTLMSRFFRARLPAPKRYLAFARLVRAARLFENPGLSVANVATHLEYSSPQSFGRHVRTLLRMTAVEFRQRYDGEGMLRRFREELVLPHLGVLRRLAPLGLPPARPARPPRPAASTAPPPRGEPPPRR